VGDVSGPRLPGVDRRRDHQPPPPLTPMPPIWAGRRDALAHRRVQVSTNRRPTPPPYRHGCQFCALARKNGGQPVLWVSRTLLARDFGAYARKDGGLTPSSSHLAGPMDMGSDNVVVCSGSVDRRSQFAVSVCGIRAIYSADPAYARRLARCVCDCRRHVPERAHGLEKATPGSPRGVCRGCYPNLGYVTAGRHGNNHVIHAQPPYVRGT